MKTEINDYEQYKEISGKFYDEYFYTSPAVKWIHELGHKAVEQFVELHGKQVLEIGAGTGYHLNFVDLDTVKEYVCLDNNPDNLKRIKKRHENLHLVIGDCNSLPFKDNSFDAVISIYMLEHITGLERTLAEAKDVLRKDGLLLFSIPTEGGFMFSLGRKLTTERNYYKHYSGMPYMDIIRMEHVNTADTVLAKVRDQFRFIKTNYAPLRIKSKHANFIISGVAKPCSSHSRKKWMRM
jgi:ubiquinone/menaquinone biosynthesis C-methylase UbiE